jgi:hypothetical protein
MSAPTTPQDSPAQQNNQKSVEWLVKPLLDDQAPLILRANCIRSLAIAAATSRDQRFRLQNGKGKASPANLSQIILQVQSAVDDVVQPFLRDDRSLGSRISTVTHLHSFNLLALLLGGSSSSHKTQQQQHSPVSRSTASSSSPSRRRLEQSHIPEWRQIVVSPPRGRGKMTGPSSPLSPKSSPTRTDAFAQDFFDTIMATEKQASEKQQHEEQSVLDAFGERDHSTRSGSLQLNASTSLLKQLTGPTHGVSPPKRVQPDVQELELPGIQQQAWQTPERRDKYKQHQNHHLSSSPSLSLSPSPLSSLEQRFPKSKHVSSPGQPPLRQVLLPPPPSPRQNAMRPLTPTKLSVPFASISSLRLHKDGELLEGRAHPIVRDVDSDEEMSRGDETGDLEWEMEERMRQKLRKQQRKMKPPMVRALRGLQKEEEMIDMLTLVAPVARSPGQTSQGVLDMIRQRPGSLVLLPPGASSGIPIPPDALAPPPSISNMSLTSSAPPAPSTTSSVFLWLPSELQRTTENLIVRTELAREATRRAQIGLAQRMAREVLKLPFDFMAMHGTPDMLIRVGALAFRVAAQHLGQRRLRETWRKLQAWLSKCRAADARKLRLLSRMAYLIEMYHDKVSKRGLKLWYKWMRKLRWIANRQRWGSTRLQRLLTKANRRNQRRRMYNAYMKLKWAVEKWHADKLRRRMAASKVRKLLWRRMVEGMKRVFFNLRRMGLEPYVVRLQWAWRKRLFRCNKLARCIQCGWRRYVATKLAKTRRTNIRANAKWFLYNIVLPPHVQRRNAVLPIQRCWRNFLDVRRRAALFIYYGWWLPSSRMRDFRECMAYYRTMAIRIQQSYRERLHRRMKPSIKLLQRKYRSRRIAKIFLYSNVYSVLLERQLCARTIARLWRGFKGRQRMRRRKKYLARQQRAALKLQRAWALNQGFFATFVLTTSLKISSGSDVDRWRKKRREVRWNATVLVQAYIRAMVARKRNKKWMAFMRRKNRHEALLWGASKFKHLCHHAATNAQRYWRGRTTRRQNYAITMSLVHRRGLRELSARVIQFAWMRSVTVVRKEWRSRGLNLHDSVRTCVGLNRAAATKKNIEKGEASKAEVTKMSDDKIKKETSMITVQIVEEEKYEFVKMSLFAHKMYMRRLRWRSTREACERGRILPYVKDIQRVWRGHVGRTVTAAAKRTRRNAMKIQNSLVRMRFARNARRSRQIVVNIQGCVLFMEGVYRGVACLNVMVYTPAARKIQNGLYRAWKAREPLRHAAAATVIQCRWRCKLSKREKRRRRKGLRRRNDNQYGDQRKLWSVFQKVERQTRDRLYHPMGDMYLKDDVDIGRWVSRLGLRSLTSVLTRRGVENLQSLYALCGFGGTVEFNVDLQTELVSGYKEMGIDVSKTELDAMKEMQQDMEQNRKKLVEIKMELAMLLPRKTKRNKNKANKLTWKQKRQKNELENAKVVCEKKLSDIKERLVLSEDGRSQRRRAALTALESKIGMKGSHQSLVACERMLSMLEGDETVVNGFMILDQVESIATAYVRIMKEKEAIKMSAEGAKNSSFLLTGKKSSLAIKPPKGFTSIGTAFGVLCLQSGVHPSSYQLEAFLSQYDKGLTLDDIRTGKVNPSTMLPRDVHAKSELQVELRCRGRAYILFREAAERMIALVAGRPLSSFLEDGTGQMHADAVQDVKNIETMVQGCDWWIKQKKKEKAQRKRSGSVTSSSDKRPSSPSSSISRPNSRGNSQTNGETLTAGAAAQQHPKTSVHTALKRLYSLMKDLVRMETCASTLQRNYRGHRGYLMFRAMRSVQVVARVTKEYMHWVDPWRDKVKEYVDKVRKKEWNEWMQHSANEYRQNGWAIWEEVYDDMSNSMYYVNDQTGETMWEPPLDGTPYIPYVPPTPEEMKKLELRKYLEQAKENIRRIEERANEEERLRQEAQAAKKIKAFEDGNMNAFLESDSESELNEDEEEEREQKEDHNAWLRTAEEDAWAKWDAWMREQWIAKKTPWYEVPHLDTGEMHYMNRETGELSNVPPPNGILYKPFEKPPQDADTTNEGGALDSKTLELMVKVKTLQDNADKKELLDMYQEKFDSAELKGTEQRREATTAYITAEQWHTNEEVQAVLRAWSIEEDDKGRTFYYHQETGTVENDPPDELVSCNEADRHAHDTRVNAEEIEDIAMDAGAAYVNRIMMFVPVETEADKGNKTSLLESVNKRINTIRIRRARCEAQHHMSTSIRALELAKNKEIKLHIESATVENEIERYGIIMAENWSVVEETMNKKEDQKEKQTEDNSGNTHSTIQQYTFTSIHDASNSIQSPPSSFPEEYVLHQASIVKGQKHAETRAQHTLHVTQLEQELASWKEKYIDAMIQSRSDNQLELSELAELEAYEAEKIELEARRKEVEMELLLSDALENAQQAQEQATALEAESEALLLQVKNEWVTKIDEESGKTYYISQSTGQSQWEVPELILTANKVADAHQRAALLAVQLETAKNEQMLAAEKARIASRDAEIDR